MSVVIAEENQLLEMERRFVEEAWNRGRLDVVDEIHGEDLVVHWLPDARDREGLKRYIRTVRRAFPDFHMAIDYTVLGEDMVTVGFTANGTHTRTFMGIPATNRLLHITGSWTHRLEDGHIVEGWSSMNGQDLFDQLGLTIPRALITVPTLYARRAFRGLRRR